MDPFWGVVIGTAVGGLLLEIWRTYKFYKNEKSPDESQFLAVISILMGLLIVIPFLSVFGLIIGITAYRKKKFKRFAVIGIWINSIVFMFTAVIILINVIK